MKQHVTKADIKFAKLLREVIRGFHRRIGKEMCSELNANCCDCKVRWVIAELNGWIDILED